MILQLPKWMCEELYKQAEGATLQYMIKDILREYIGSEEGKIMRERIRIKRGRINR